MDKNLKLIYDSAFGEAFILPKGYDSSFKKISISEAKTYSDGSKVTLSGVVDNFRIKPVGKFANIYADLKSGPDRIMLQWPSSIDKAEFKKRKLEEQLFGKHCDISGSLASFGNGPDKFIFLTKIQLKESNESTAESTLMPLYELKKGVKPFELLKAIKNSIEIVESDFLTMPNQVENVLSLPKLKDSLYIVHSLKTAEDVSQEAMLQSNTIYHRRIKLELLWRTLVMLDQDNLEDPSPAVEYSKDDMLTLESKLNIQLTKEQKISLGKIFKIFNEGIFRRTLLQGDVGSGKTYVSIFATLAMLKAGFQVAVLAPSSVLAKQLFEEYAQALGNEFPVLFINSGSSKKEKTKIQNIATENNPCVIVGTRSVNGVDFKNLGLVIIDEEQKFGVDVKDFLIHKKNENLKPYQILMSATPIPRSLASAMFGNVEVATIKAKPAGREPVKTKIINNQTEADKLFDFINNEISKGNKAIAVVPSIGSEDMASIEKATQLCSEKLGSEKVIIIHGKMTEKEQVENVEKYKSGNGAILIATSMVEAGFSDPKISSVIIFDPDRFGLSQLHQIRGRGGRSAGLKAYCALFPLNFQLKDKAFDRLTMFSQNHDGFALANEDLQIRGSGKLIGTEQSGGGDLNFIDNYEDVITLKEFLKSTQVRKKRSEWDW